MAINFPTPATVGETFTDSSGVVFTWNGYGWTQGGTAAPPAPVDAYTKTESDANFVNVPGDTMTGQLIIQNYLQIDPPTGLGAINIKTADATSTLTFWNVGAPKFGIDSTPLILSITRYDDAGVGLGAALIIDRATGNTTLSGNLTVQKSYPEVIVNNIAGGPAGDFGFKKDGLYRWLLRDEPIGDGFTIINFDDAGVAIGGAPPLTISRANKMMTLSGDLQIIKPDPIIRLTKAASGQAASIFGCGANNGLRWNIELGNNDLEDGVVDGTLGSNLVIHRYKNDGNYIGQVLNINRASGAASFNSSGTFDVKNTTAGVVASFTNDQVGANGCIAVGGMYVSYMGSVSGYPGMFKDAGVTGAFWYDTNNSFLSVAGGGRFSADVRIEMPTAALYLNDLGGIGNFIVARKNGAPRWEMAIGSGTETGSNSGSDFSLARYDDAAVGKIALDIARNDGDVGVYANLFLRTAGTTISVGPGSDWYPAIRMNFLGGGTQQGLLSAPAVDDATSMWCQNVAKSIVGGISQTATAVAFNVASAAEMKEDLKSFDAGNIIDDTKVYDFAWKSTGERAYGVVAQEAHAVYPQAVTHTLTDQKFEWWGVDYSKYVPVILQELKRLRERVRELETNTSGPIVTPQRKN